MDASTKLAGRLTVENYQNGFLIDDEALAGVSKQSDPVSGGDQYLAYVLDHLTAEHRIAQPFKQLEDALGFINSLQRRWTFESASDCGACGEGNTCTKSQCGKGHCHLDDKSSASQ